MTNNLPTDDVLIRKGCTLVSICSHCGNSDEIVYHHLFFLCPFAQQIWPTLQSHLPMDSPLAPFNSCMSVSNS